MFSFKETVDVISINNARQTKINCILDLNFIGFQLLTPRVEDPCFDFGYRTNLFFSYLLKLVLTRMSKNIRW